MFGNNAMLCQFGSYPLWISARFIYFIHCNNDRDIACFGMLYCFYGLRFNPIISSYN